MQHDTIRCLVGWPTDSEQDRLVRVDALDAARASVDKTIILEREGMKQRPGTLELMHRPRDWTRLWLRFDDATLNTAWSTLDVTPSQYWHYPTRTFDLTKARLEKYRRDKQGVAARTGSVFGLPIHGAIALKNKQGLQVTISFCQRNASLEGGITYDVTPYDAKMFKSPDQRMLDRNMGTTHGLKLPDGSSFEVALSAEEISEHMVAHLAVTLSNSEPRSREASVLRGSSRRRNPLDLIRKSRGGNAVAKDTQSIASNAR
ncbi:hypothetical protein B0A55_04348 [Friedmanniomyces simplex]|uniref:Uncharacterized protein n=1 Tax=Friedmanniomyces simplex TaxID=329884 RepID=A0A4U0XQU0_9PEZI|nr:hypothetical protein B0A55_04348 [Friedmanniomyces simplex]